MFDLKTLRGQGLAAAIISILIYVVVAGSGMWGINQLSNNINKLSTEVAKKTDLISPLLQVSNDIKNDVVQVQQWLTDISATRAQDGLNDGFDVADEFAQKFNTDTTVALKLANELELTGVIQILKSMQASFTAYYSTGKKMAKAYIDLGPDGGNKMMGQFDGTAARIGGSVDKLMEAVIALDQHETEIMRTSSAVANENSQSKMLILGVLFLVGAVLLVLIAYKTDEILRIITAVSRALDRAEKGDLDVRIYRVMGSGEAARVQNSFNHVMDVTECYVREVRASMAFVSKGWYFRTIQEGGFGGSFLASVKRLNQSVGITYNQNSDFSVIAKQFEENMNAVVQTVTSAATELQATAKSMEQTASVTSDKSQTVATAAEMASNNVQTVASAAEELSSSITEISSQVSHSAEIASQAVIDAEKSGKNIQGLSDSASKIGEVVSLISDIADQTNLLALNATIEAARAGDAGKGFAVVASEVKNLANQTAKATEEISMQVGGVQKSTEDAVLAIKNIGATISKIDEAATTIASAVEEQGAATQEIARNVEQAAIGTNDVTENITEVTVGASETGHAATEVLSAAEELAKQGAAMSEEMNVFLHAMRKVIK